MTSGQIIEHDEDFRVPEPAFAKRPRGEILPGSPRSVAEAKRVAKEQQVRLTAGFTSDLRKLWEEQGESIMRRAAFADPVGTLKVFASLMPKQLDVTTTNLEEIDNDKIDRLIGAVGELLEGRLVAVEAAVGEREGAQDSGTATVDVQALL